MKAVEGLFLAVVLVACGDDNNKNNNKVDAAVPMIDAPPPMAMIGPEGGVIASTDGIVALTIPPNAVSTATAFSIEVATTVPTEVAQASLVGPVYDIKPEGTVFAVPATLTWTFSTPPAATNDAMGRPRFLFGYSLSDAGALEPHVDTGRSVGTTALTVTSKIAHLSKHFLMIAFQPSYEVWREFGSVEMELGGGDYAVDTEWNVPLVAVHTEDIFLGVTLSASREAVTAPVTDVSPTEWFESEEIQQNFRYYEGPRSMGAGDTFVFTPQARFLCAFNSAGKAAMTVWVDHKDFADRDVTAYATKTENVNCIVRPEKTEYTNEVTTIGAAKIMSVAAPSSNMLDLTAEGGLYGYRIPIAAGQTIRVCVLTNGSTSLNYYPRYSPGFNFVDGQQGSGCTDITNLDTKNPNEVLLKLSGTGTVVSIEITVP